MLEYAVWLLIITMPNPTDTQRAVIFNDHAICEDAIAAAEKDVPGSKGECKPFVFLIPKDDAP